MTKLNVCYSLNKRSYYPKIEIDKDWEDIRPRDVIAKIPKEAFLVGYCPSKYANMTFEEIEKDIKEAAEVEYEAFVRHKEKMNGHRNSKKL